MLGKITVGLLFLLLVWGNLVAGMKAGLGCPDWPLCHGRVVPPLGLETYMEYMHRVIAACATSLLAVLSYNRFKAYTGPFRAVPVVSVLLVAAEVVLGGMVVLLGLPMELTVFHFTAGLTVFLLAFYMMSFDGVTHRPAFSIGGPGALYPVFGLVVFMQAVLGAYVRHSGSGLSCPDFPACLGSVFPRLVDGHVAAHFSHRLVGYLILATAFLIYGFTASVRRPHMEKDLAVVLAVLVLIQVAAGAVVVLTGLYYLATALHMAVALSILMVLGLMWKASVQKAGGSS